MRKENTIKKIYKWKSMRKRKDIYVVRGGPKLDAYFTVEAVLILPIALAVIILIMYLWFFQYDRCLLEQDMGMLALRGAALREEDYGERYSQIKEWSEEMYQEKYVAWEKGDTKIKIENGQLKISGEALIRFPFKGLQFWEAENKWQIRAVYQNEILSPASVLRKYRRLKEGV